MGNVNFPLINEDVLRVHVEDAAFLAGLRERALEAPNYRLIDIYDVENRLQAHLDAAAMAGAAGARLAAVQLADDPGFGACFVAAHLGLRNGRHDGLDAALGTAGQDPAMLAGVALAASWCEPATLAPHMARWITAADPRLVRVALSTCGDHRTNPGDHLNRLVRHADAEVRARAWRVAGELGCADLASRAASAAGDEASPMFEAAWAACLLGDLENAPRRLATALEEGLPPAQARRAAELAPLCLPEDESRSLVQRLLAQPETSRWGLVALGARGLADALPWLCAQMNNPLAARAAGAAFERIAGADLKRDDLELDVFPESPDDPVTDTDPVESFIEAATPWPDPDRVRSWLAEHSGRFGSETRYLFGVAAWSYSTPPDPALRYQARFRAVAHDLALRRHETPLPNWRARVTLQSGRFGRAW